MLIAGRFTLCLIDQEFRDDTNDGFMVSRVSFSLFYQGREIEGTVLIKQTAGADFESDPLEVSSPDGEVARLPFNHNAFRPLAEHYYRQCCSAAPGAAIRVRAPGVRVHGVLVSRQLPFQLEVESGGPTAW